MLPFISSLSLAIASPSLINKPDSSVKITPHFELGFVTPLSHTLRFGEDGTNFDYVEEGAQDNLFPYLRLAVDVNLGKRNHLSFLYQPLNLKTRFNARQELKFNQNV